MMDFQNQRRVEEEDEEMEMEEEEEEDDDDDDDASLPPTNYDSSVPNSSSRPFKMPNEPRSASPLPLSLSFPTAKRPARYRECLKNHAVGIGGHAVDGCCEFMPAGPEGSLDALKCAACNCHRNFHRKEVDPTVPQQIQSPPVSYYPHPQQPPPAHPVLQFYPYGSRGGYPHQRPLALPSSSGGTRRHGGGVETEEHEIILEPLSAMGLGMSSASALALGKKRHRTKFTAEQKEKMLGLAEKVGWRLQKQDEAVIQQFCDDSGIRRHVLKVWMHNNKHTLGKIRNPN